MPILTPSSETAPTTARGAVRVGSTARILASLERGLTHTSILSTTPYFVNEIAGNLNLKSVQETVTNLKKDRDSIFRIKAELEVVLIPALEKSLEKSTLKPDLKNSLLPLQRAKNLIGIIEQATEIDMRFSTLEEGLATLAAERLKTKQEHYKAIETANNPREKAAQLLQTDKTNQSTIKGYEEKVTQDTKLFQHLHKKIRTEYNFLCDLAPSSLRMKKFQDLSASSTPSIDQPLTARMPGTRGG